MHGGRRLWFSTPRFVASNDTHLYELVLSVMTFDRHRRHAQQVTRYLRTSPPDHRRANIDNLSGHPRQCGTSSAETRTGYMQSLSACPTLDEVSCLKGHRRTFRGRWATGEPRQEQCRKSTDLNIVRQETATLRFSSGFGENTHLHIIKIFQDYSHRVTND